MGNKRTLREDGTASATEQSDRSANAVLDDLTHRLLEQESTFRAFLRKRLSDDAVTEDLLQQSLMKAVERGHELKKSDSAVSWFYRILRNAVADYYRSHDADHRKVEGLRQEMIAAGEDKMPALDEIRPAICTCLDPLLKEMRPAYAHLLERIDLKGESPAAVAKELKLTTNNLTVRLHRARQALRASLEQACGICTKHGCLNCTCPQ
jgi:RNA polymerase sigma-70 factor (ECF subfamily)